MGGGFHISRLEASSEWFLLINDEASGRKAFFDPRGMKFFLRNMLVSLTSASGSVSVIM